MEFAGIIAEYDPFHNGHAWQLAEARRMGASHTAVALSCGLTQRGAPPLLPEAVRVRAALESGASLVFALPAPWAMSGAESFARAGVKLLAAAGCDALVFGAETPDPGLLTRAARVLASPAYREALKQQLAAGARNFAAARQMAVEQVCPSAGLSQLLDRPPLTPVPLPRQGADHGQAQTAGRYASASALRALWSQEGPEALAPYVPASALDLYREARAAGQYTDFGAVSLAALSRLRARQDFAGVRGAAEGLEHRLAQAVRQAVTLEGLWDDLTTVRYPRARMRRLVMDAVLGYGSGSGWLDLPALPPYLHLLGLRREAAGLLARASLPVSPSLAKLARENPDCARTVRAQAAAADFTALCRRTPGPMGIAFTQPLIKL